MDPLLLRFFHFLDRMSCPALEVLDCRAAHGQHVQPRDAASEPSSTLRGTTHRAAALQYILLSPHFATEPVFVRPSWLTPLLSCYFF